MKKSLVVNLIAPPGSGKSTMAANIFAKLKWLGIECELVNEFAKDLVWEDRTETFKNQVYIFAKQFHKMFRLDGKVDVIITDSPLILSIYYNNKYCEGKFKQLNPLVLEQHCNFYNLNFYINRKKKYSPNGRNQTEEESSLMGIEIKELLEEYKIYHEEIDGIEANVDIIVDRIVQSLQDCR